MNEFMRRIAASICLVWLAPGWSLGEDAKQPDWPPFQEVLQVIRTNLPDVSESELNAAMVRGLIARLQPRVELVSPDESVPVQNSKPWVSRAEVFEDSVGYLRVAGIGAGLPEELSTQWEALRGTNKLNALILDLRFAEGHDYPAAAHAADLFVQGEKQLLAWDETVIRSTGKAGASLPLAILANGETRGAAEALVAALRETGTALIIGSRTAGQAYVFREFALNGRILRIASMPVEAGKDRTLKEGVPPDIETRVPVDQERIHYSDPYATLPGEVEVARSTRPRITEAELVRRRREGELNFLSGAPAAESVGSPVAEKELRDPALIQALDVLKGIVIVGASPSASAK